MATAGDITIRVELSDEDRSLLKRVEEKLDSVLSIAAGESFESNETESPPDRIALAFAQMHARKRSRR